MRNVLVLILIVVLLTGGLVGILLALQAPGAAESMPMMGASGAQAQPRATPSRPAPAEHQHDDMHQMMEECTQMMKGMGQMMRMMGMMGQIMGPGSRLPSH